jgi:hypothetical protein
MLSRINAVGLVSGIEGIHKKEKGTGFPLPLLFFNAVYF